MELQHVPELATVDFTRLKAHVLYWSTFTDPEGDVITFTVWVNNPQDTRFGQFGLRCDWNFAKTNKDAISISAPRECFGEKMLAQAKAMMAPGALVRNLS